MGAYRFFENDAFEWADILQPHIQSSMGRMAAHPVVLCIQDTTELDATLMFEADEWKAAYILNKQRLPDKPPSLNEVVRLIARLGGFLARKGDGEPGVKTIWLGMQRIIDFAAGIKFSRELLDQGSCV